jgi:uncharacterized membrane protein YbhN (UPF0104 family)
MEGFQTDPVHEENGKWYFLDETWADRHGPYVTEEEARIALYCYCQWVLEGKEHRKYPGPMTATDRLLLLVMLLLSLFIWGGFACGIYFLTKNLI